MAREVKNMFPTLHMRRTVARRSPIILALALPSWASAEEAPSDPNQQVSKPSGEKFIGRVVLASDPEQGVAGIGVSGHAIEIADFRNSWRIHTRTDKDGYFTGQAIDERGYLVVFDSAQLRGTIQVVEPGQSDIVLSLAPTATIRGTVFDAQNEVPAVRHSISAEVQFAPDQRWSNTSLSRKSYTNDEGRFQIEGLIPGFKYRITARSPDADVYHLGRSIGNVEPTAAEHINLGQLEIPKTRPNLKEFIAARYLDKPPEERLKRGLNMANLGSVRLLVIAMERNNEAAKQFYKFLYDYSYDGRSVNREELNLKIYQYIPLSIAPSEAGDFLKQHGITIPAEEDGTIAVLDSTGEVVAQTSFTKLKRSNDQFAPPFFAEFLESHLHPPLMSARESLDGALAEALRDNKRIFIQTGGPGCGPCYLLAEYFDEHKALISKDYVVLKLDYRMPEFKEVYEKLTSGTPRGAPWMTILNAEGDSLITGDNDEGNIGFPSSPAGIEQFKSMLTKTRQRLTDEEIATLLMALQKKADEIEKRQKKY